MSGIRGYQFIDKLSAYGTELWQNPEACVHHPQRTRTGVLIQSPCRTIHILLIWQAKGRDEVIRAQEANIQLTWGIQNNDEPSETMISAPLKNLTHFLTHMKLPVQQFYVVWA